MNNSNTNWQSSSATGSPDNLTFIDLTKPQVVDVEQLEQCADRHVAPNPDDAETAVYHLIGRVDGVISRGPAPTQNDDGACVLYMNADGEAFERHIPAVAGDWSDIPRTMVAPVGHTQATKWMQMAYEQAIEAHAKVDFRAASEILVADNGTEIMTDGGEDVDDIPSLHVGDHVVDCDEDEDAATMLVVGLGTLRADAYPLGDEGPTVADVNPDYPETDDVVEVTFPQRTDMDVDNKRYAYPRSRLQLKRPIHSRDGDFADDAVPTWGAVKTLAEHIVESHTNIDDRLNKIEDRLDRAERDIDIIDGGI